MDDRIQTLTLGGTEYVILPRSEYERLTEQAGGDTNAVDAATFGRETLGRNLRQARESAGLTQEELAARLRKSQPMVSGAESGRVKVGAAYVKAVLRACGLPNDWAPPKPRGKKEAPAKPGPGSHSSKARKKAPAST